MAAGSILKWGDVEEGTRFDPVITQFHYKDDPLHDPMLDESFVEYIIRAKEGGEVYQQMREINSEVFTHLEAAFGRFKVQLLDFKLEYGLINDEVTLIDEITGGSFRLWPYAKDNPDLSGDNVLSELDPKGKLDKDVYRQGGSLSNVQSKFEQIATITAGFKDIE